MESLSPPATRIPPSRPLPRPVQRPGAQEYTAPQDAVGDYGYRTPQDVRKGKSSEKYPFPPYYYYYYYYYFFFFFFFCCCCCIFLQFLYSLSYFFTRASSYVFFRPFHSFTIPWLQQCFSSCTLLPLSVAPLLSPQQMAIRNSPPRMLFNPAPPVHPLSLAERCLAWHQRRDLPSFHSGLPHLLRVLLSQLQ